MRAAAAPKHVFKFVSSINCKFEKETIIIIGCLLMIAANYVETNKQRASLHLVHFSSLRPYCNIKFFTNGAHRTTAYKSAATTAVGILEAKLKSRTTSDVAGGGGGVARWRVIHMSL